MHRKIRNLLAYKILRDLKNFCAGFIRFVCSWLHKMALTIEDHHYDNRLGIETERSFPFKDTSINRDMILYLPAPYDKIRKIMDYLRLTPDDVFVDIGCGAGRVVFFAAGQKLKKIVGVELNKELIDVARENYRNLRINNAPVEIVHGDAVDFDVNEGTVFFMYNPFGSKTLTELIDKIRKSLTIHPRRIRIVYYGPQYRYLLDGEGWLELEKEMDGGDVLIWRSRL